MYSIRKHPCQVHGRRGEASCSKFPTANANCSPERPLGTTRRLFNYDLLRQSPTRSVKGHLIRSNSTNHFAASPSRNPRLIVIVRCTAISFSSSGRRYSISGHAPRTFPLHHRVSRSFVLPCCLSALSSPTRFLRGAVLHRALSCSKNGPQ